MKPILHNRPKRKPDVMQSGPPDGTTHKASGDLTIEGSVGACRIICSGNLIVHGGILGRGVGELRIGGTLSARFLSRVQVHCGGNIEIASEVNDCDLTANGHVTLTHGTIAGGTVRAALGVIAAVVGSDSGTETLIVLGDNTRIEKTLDRLYHQQTAVTDSIEKIRLAVEPRLNDRDLLTDQQVEALKQLGQRLQNLLAIRVALDSKIDAIHRDTKTNQSQTLFVRDTLFAGVRVDFGEADKKIREDMTGPIRVWFNESLQQVRVYSVRNPVRDKEVVPNKQLT